MKKHLLLGILICVFSVQLLSAQTCLPPAKVLPSSGLASGPTGQAISGGCNPDPTPNPTPTPTPTPTPLSGFVEPKYVVLTVTYAPPGSKSTVTYSNSTILGTGSSVTNSFTNDVKVSASTTNGIDIFGLIEDRTTITASGELTQESDTTSTIAVNETTNTSTIIPGPASSAVGLDHDEDIIWVWLNPAIGFNIDSTTFTNFTWTGFAFDQNDPAGTTDVIGVPVKYLDGHAPMPSNIADVLARRWSSRTLCTSTDPACGPDGTKDPGLDASDLAAILKADPFANPSYVINIPSGSSCTADSRFCRTSNTNLQYSPPPPGGQPITQTYSIQRQATATQGQGATDSRNVGLSIQGSLSANFFVKFGAKLSAADTLTWTNKWNALSSSQVGQTATASITGPSSADNYTGPVEFDIFQDNIYGTFMFGFIPAPTFTLFASPSSQSVVQGSCTSYTASISALVSGFSSTVSFSVSGVPSNATATFSPASVTGAGNSTLTVCTSSSTPTGTSNLTINAVSGIEVHSTGVALTVNAPPPPPDFKFAASPSLLDIATSPGSATSTITVSPISGFNGTVSLSVNGGGLNASLSSTSINSSGSVTLTVSDTSLTPAGNYVVTVTGTSGNLSHSIQISVTVDAPSGGGGGGGGGGCRTCPTP